MPKLPTPSVKNDTGDFERFTQFTRQILSLPHAEIKAKLDAEKEAKRTIESASRVPDVPSKRSQIADSPTLPVGSAWMRRFPATCDIASINLSASVNGLSFAARLLLQNT